MVDCHSKNSTGVDFINCFAPCADLLRPTPNICASKKLLKNWVQGAKVGRKGAKLFMKLTPGVCWGGGVGERPLCSCVSGCKKAQISQLYFYGFGILSETSFS